MDVLKRSKAVVLAIAAGAALSLGAALGPLQAQAQTDESATPVAKPSPSQQAKKPARNAAVHSFRQVKKPPVQEPAQATDASNPADQTKPSRQVAKPGRTTVVHSVRRVKKPPVQEPAQATDTSDPAAAAAPVRSARKPGHKPAVQAAQGTKKPTVLTRPEFSEDDQQRAEIPGFPGVRFWSSSAEDYAREVPTQPGPWLVLSSGGEDGAYGAGFLNGWTAAGNRPDFPVVTGISTGALMAVYAFAGPKYDKTLRDAYTTISAGDIFEVSPTPESLVDTWPLRRLIQKSVTPDVLADVAEQYKRGRRLFVLTTDLDAGRSVVWDMGAIAAKGGEPALKLFQDVLAASASIPGVFPPVYIEAEANGHRFMEMHVDGGVNGPMYIAPESYLFPGSSRRLPMSQLYIILNGKITTEFYEPARTTATILGRSISLALQLGARMDLMLFHQAARRDGIGFNLALVDSGFSNKERGAFDPDYMKALFDRGFEQGSKNNFLKELPFRKPTAVSEGAGGPTPQQ